MTLMEKLQPLKVRAEQKGHDPVRRCQVCFHGQHWFQEQVREQCVRAVPTCDVVYVVHWHPVTYAVLNTEAEYLVLCENVNVSGDV